MGWGLAGHLLIGWGMYTGWGKNRTNTFSRWGRRGYRLYCSINSYNIGEGKTISVWFFCSCIPRSSLVLSAFSSLDHHREGDDRGWDGWMVSPTWWTWVWANSRRQWKTVKPGMLQSMGSQRVGQDWTTEQLQQLGTFCGSSPATMPPAHTSWDVRSPSQQLCCPVA